MYDLYSGYPSHVGSRRPVNSRNLSPSWRTSSSVQERVESWREMRRDAMRERQRLSRERDVLRRRRRYYFSAQLQRVCSLYLIINFNFPPRDRFLI